MIGGSSFTVGIYVLIQFVKFKKDRNSKIIFLPLWFNSKLLVASTYAFPKDLKYIDKEYYDYVLTDMNQLNTTNEKSDADNFSQILMDENIKYKVLEELSLNTSIRRMFKLPLGIDLDSSKFKIWIATKYPTVSGVQINMDNINGKSSTNMGWVIKLINFRSIINDALILAGLKLDRISTDESMRGPVIDKNIKQIKTMSDRKHINTNKEYDVLFCGEFKIKDKNKNNRGVLHYKGMFDFSHLMMNRGVKIIEMEMDLISQDNESESTRYKIL